MLMSHLHQRNRLTALCCRRGRKECSVECCQNNAHSLVEKLGCAFHNGSSCCCCCCWCRKRQADTRLILTMLRRMIVDILPALRRAMAAGIYSAAVGASDAFHPVRSHSATVNTWLVCERRALDNLPAPRLLDAYTWHDGWECIAEYTERTLACSVYTFIIDVVHCRPLVEELVIYV